MNKKLTKIAAILLALAACLTLAACGGSDSGKDNGNDNNANQNGNQSGGTYVFKLKGTEIAVDADAAPIISALGEPTKYFESDSCAFQGKDKVWTYGGVVISSYPDGDKDYILSIDLKDDSVSTPEGIYIGSSEADVKAAYGTPTSTTDTALEYVKGSVTLTFIISAEKVTGITYTSGVLSE